MYYRRTEEDVGRYVTRELVDSVGLQLGAFPRIVALRICVAYSTRGLAASDALIPNIKAMMSE
jgi:hypothetical protein